jgi:hypothetical protein
MPCGIPEKEDLSIRGDYHDLTEAWLQEGVALYLNTSLYCKGVRRIDRKSGR